MSMKTVLTHIFLYFFLKVYLSKGASFNFPQITYSKNRGRDWKNVVIGRNGEAVANRKHLVVLNMLNLL